MDNGKKVLLIHNARQLLTMEGDHNNDIGLIEGGSVLIRDGLIEAAGKTGDIEKLAGGLRAGGTEVETIDATGKVVLPGFIDCHTHVTFGGSRVAAYAVSVVDDNPETLAKKLKAQTKRRLENMFMNGTTTLEGKSGYGLTMESELRMLEVNRELNEELPLDIFSTFLGAHGWTEGMKKEDYIDLLCKEMIPRVGKRM